MFQQPNESMKINSTPAGAPTPIAYNVSTLTSVVTSICLGSEGAVPHDNVAKSAEKAVRCMAPLVQWADFRWKRGPSEVGHERVLDFLQDGHTIQTQEGEPIFWKSGSWHRMSGRDIAHDKIKRYIMGGQTTLYGTEPKIAEDAFSVSASHDETDEAEYPVDRILERWGTNLFLLRWLNEKSCWWVPRENISQHLVKTFEEDYNGFHLGVEVLRTRKGRSGKPEYRVRWAGRPEDEDAWVQEKHMSPDMIERHKPYRRKAMKRKRRLGLY